MAFKAAIRLDSTYSHPHCNLAAVYHSRKQHIEAIAESRAAIRLDRTDAAVHKLLGLALEQLGNKEQACIAMKEAARLEALTEPVEPGGPKAVTPFSEPVAALPDWATDEQKRPDRLS